MCVFQECTIHTGFTPHQTRCLLVYLSSLGQVESRAPLSLRECPRSLHSIWIGRIRVNLITLLTWLFLLFNCMCCCGGSAKLFQFGTQLQTTSLRPRLRAQYGSGLYMPRLQSGFCRYTSQNNQGLQQKQLRRWPKIA